MQDYIASLTKQIEQAFDPVDYITSLRSGIIPEPYEWQKQVLRSDAQFIHINGARRSGKSVIISCKPAHYAKVMPGSVTLILGPTQTQANEDMRLVKGLIHHDHEYPDIVRMSDQQIELGNGSRIIVVPATEVSARGYPDPDLIITDESAFITDIIHRDCLSPMLNDNPDCKWLQISTTNGKQNDPGKFFYESSLNSMWERYEVRAPFEVDPTNPMNLVPSLPEKKYKKEKASQGIKAFYSPRHMSLSEQLILLSMQGPSKYQRNQLALFVESEEQVFSYDDIKRFMDGDAKPLTMGLTESDNHALFA